MQEFIPLLSGAFGALIGASASVIVMILQQRAQSRREKLNMAAQMALEDHKQHMNASTGKHLSIQPIVVYLHYYLRLMEEIEGHNLTPETLRRITQDNIHISRIIESINKEHTASPR